MKNLIDFPGKRLPLRRQIACNLVALTIGVLVLASHALADPITYGMGYDPGTGITTLSNSAGSSADLQFETLLGSLSGQTLFVAPGDTVTIDAAGDVSGPYIPDPPGGPVKCVNKTYNNGTFTVTQGFVGTISIHVPSTPDQPPQDINYTFDGSGNYSFTDNGASGSSSFPPSGMITTPKFGTGKITVPAGPVAPAPLVSANVDAVISPTESDTSFMIESPDWEGTPGQANVELFSGTVESVDNTSSFTTLFTDSTMTGCTPEPSSVVLLLTGMAMAGALGRRKLLARGSGNRET